MRIMRGLCWNRVTRGDAEEDMSTLDNCVDVTATVSALNHTISRVEACLEVLGVINNLERKRNYQLLRKTQLSLTLIRDNISWRLKYFASPTLPSLFLAISQSANINILSS